MISWHSLGTWILLLILVTYYFKKLLKRCKNGKAEEVPDRGRI